MPQDMCDTEIPGLYKNKATRSDCNNHIGISLFGDDGKTFARVVLPRLQQLAERVYPEFQFGFRSKRATNDMIFMYDSCKKNAVNRTCLCISLSLTLLKCLI